MKTEVYHAKNWYIEAYHIAEHWALQYGYTVPQVAGIIAATSPLQPWSKNLAWTRSILRDKTPRRYGLRKNYEKALAIKAGAKPSEILKGEKVRAFYASILRPRGSSIVIDRHMLKSIQYPKRTLTKKQYQKIASYFRDKAQGHGIPGNEYQAMVWVAISGRV